MILEESRQRARARHSLWESGQALAEFAIILFVLMLILMGTIDFGRAVYARNVIANAAREGARYAILHPSDETEIANRAKKLVAGLQMDHVAISVVPTGDPRMVQVDVVYTFHPVTLLIGQFLDGGSGLSLTLRASSRMFVEGE